MGAQRNTGKKAVPPRGILTAKTRNRKRASRARRGNGGGGRKMPERWRLKEHLRTTE